MTERIQQQNEAYLTISLGDVYIFSQSALHLLDQTPAQGCSCTSHPLQGRQIEFVGERVVGEVQNHRRNDKGVCDPVSIYGLKESFRREAR